MYVRAWYGMHKIAAAAVSSSNVTSALIRLEQEASSSTTRRHALKCWHRSRQRKIGGEVVDIRQKLARVKLLSIAISVQQPRTGHPGTPMPFTGLQDDLQKWLYDGLTGWWTTGPASV